MVLNTHKPSGTFTSRPLDAGDARVTAATLTATGTAPSGTAITYETRTADDRRRAGHAATWPRSAPAAPSRPRSGSLQYRATLTRPIAATTPRLDKVDLAFTIDDAAPVVTIQRVAVSGTTRDGDVHSDGAAARDHARSTAPRSPPARARRSSAA